MIQKWKDKRKQKQFQKYLWKQRVKQEDQRLEETKKILPGV